MKREGWVPRFDALAEAFFVEHDVPGGAVAVTVDDEVVLSRGYGLRDREAGLPATETTRFGVASLSKSFTALTLLSLAADGVLHLDDPVTRWLPGFDYPGLRPEAPVRLRHMLSHTSGIPPLRALDYGIHPSQAGDPAAAFNERSYDDAPPMGTYEDLLAYLRRGEGPLVAPPGEVVSYSNDAYGLLGAVVEAAAGMPFADAVRAHVFGPLEMEGATFDTAEARASGELTQLYTPVPGGGMIASPRWEEAPAHLATGFMKASVCDLACCLRALVANDHPRLGIAPEALASLREAGGWAEPFTHYGLGWMVQADYHGVTLVRHGGSLKGISAHQGFVPERGVGVVVLCNLDDVPVKRLWAAGINLALGLPPDTPLHHAPLDATPRGPAPAAVEGLYTSGEPWGRFEVREEDGVLRAYTGEDGTLAGRLAWLDDRTFVLETDEGAWSGGRFHLNEAGEAIAAQQGMRWKVRQSGSRSLGSRAWG